MRLTRLQVSDLSRASEWLHNEDFDTKTDTKRYKKTTEILDSLLRDYPNKKTFLINPL